MLVTGSLLALQPLASSFVVAAQQYDCSVSASGAWDCAPKTPAAALPPRPVHDGSAVSDSGAAPADSSSGEEAGEKPMLVTEAKGRGLKSRSADYSHLDWVPRENLTPAQLAETGPYCSGAYIEPTRPGMNDKTAKSDAPPPSSAPRLHAISRKNRWRPWPVTWSCARAACRSRPTRPACTRPKNRGELSGNVRVRDNGALIVGDHADVQLDTGEAKVDNAEYVMHKSRIRGNALYAKRAENAIIRLKDGTYTTCEPNSNAWTLKGNNITLNPATGFGTATNVTLRVKDIPVLYTPYIYFPIDDRRQSGFLPPTIGSGSDTGFLLVTPYYFNLAPNYDATLYPRYMSKRGMLMEGEFRYLTKSSEGQFGAAYLNDEEDERAKQSDYSKTRYMYNWQHKGGLDSRVLTEVDYTKISDPYYFQDLQTDQIGVESRDYVNQQGAISYRGDNYVARLNAQAYQMATISKITPYDRLPQITFNGALPQHPYGLDFAYQTELVRFDRNLRNGLYSNDEGVTSPWLDNNIRGLARANGNRLNLAPVMSLPMEASYGYIKPSLKYQYTQYDLDLDGRGKSQIAAQSAEADRLQGTYSSNQSRGIPIASIDSGLYF
nr:hypothetical protein GCM10020185_41490 [Pseudomonas brassicacearum subsp. brassicacearum]